MPVGTVVNAYGQIVLNPGVGSAPAPLDSAIPTPAPAAKALAPTPLATPMFTNTPAPSSSASGGTADGTTVGLPSTLLRDLKST